MDPGRTVEGNVLHEGIYGLKLEPGTSQSTMDPGSHSSPQHYAPIKFIDVEQSNEPSFELPDSHSLNQLCNLYYPAILSLRAPAQPADATCSTPGCNENGPYYRCSSCLPTGWYCCECIKKQHQNLLFHYISAWDPKRGFHVSTPWQQLEMVWALQHEDGSACESRTAVRNLMVLHVNGIHNFHYYRCSCSIGSQHRRSAPPTQLLANKLFPATSSYPTVAFSFELLEQFDALNLSGFINIKQYCDAVLALTPRELRNHKAEVSETIL